MVIYKRDMNEHLRWMDRQIDKERKREMDRLKYIPLIYDCHLWIDQLIGLMGWVFANSPRDWGSIPCWAIPKTQKMVLDASLLNIQHYKVCIKGIYIYIYIYLRKIKINLILCKYGIWKNQDNQRRYLFIYELYPNLSYFAFFVPLSSG